MLASVCNYESICWVLVAQQVASTQQWQLAVPAHEQEAAS